MLKAVAFAAEKHRRQKRKDVVASPYINHPLAVASTLVVDQIRGTNAGLEKAFDAAYARRPE